MLFLPYAWSKSTDQEIERYNAEVRNFFETLNVHPDVLVATKDLVPAVHKFNIPRYFEWLGNFKDDDKITYYQLRIVFSLRLFNFFIFNSNFY